MKLILYSADLREQLRIPYAQEGVRAGFPSPAADYMNDAIDLNKELIPHPATTFYARCVGDSMKDCGISDGDLLVIDKSLEPKEGDIVVAFIDGEFTLKRIHIGEDEQCLYLMPENRDYTPIRVTEENHFMVWGVVTYNIKKQISHS